MAAFTKPPSRSWSLLFLTVTYLALGIAYLQAQTAPASDVQAMTVTKKQPTEVVLTELQASRLELALQRELGAAKDLELLRFQFEKRQKDHETLKAASAAAFEAACKETGLDPKRTKPSPDLKRLIEEPEPKTDKKAGDK